MVIRAPGMPVMKHGLLGLIHGDEEILLACSHLEDCTRVWNRVIDGVESQPESGSATRSGRK